MEERIQVKEENLQKVYSDLKGRGFTLDEINEEISAEFRNHLYKGTTFDEKVFEKLQKLYGKNIAHEKIFFVNGHGSKEKIGLIKNERLAELVGIILGDGHIDKHSRDRGDRFISNYYVSVTLHENEELIIQKVERLLSACLNRETKRETLKDIKAVNIKIYGKEVVEALESIDLEAGNKVEKQVSVPEWIKEERNLSKACLRGLIDTDGSIYERKEGERIVYFKNRSKPLLKDFSEMCEKFDIRVSRAGEDARQVAAQSHVERFIDLISPIKAKTSTN